MGATDIETMANVTIAKYDFDDEVFNEISDDAKDFIQKLLVKDKEYVNCSSYAIYNICLTKLSTSCVNTPNVIERNFLPDVQKQNFTNLS
jgi:sulfate adenylyltransferase subunit 1 (EFTu-like GTPase family)